MTEELDPREAARARRRDRDAAAAQRDLMRPGMGKVFKQIQDAQRKAAGDPQPTRRRPREPEGREPERRSLEGRPPEGRPPEDAAG